MFITSGRFDYYWKKNTNSASAKESNRHCNNSAPNENVNQLIIAGLTDFYRVLDEEWMLFIIPILDKLEYKLFQSEREQHCHLE